MCRHVAYLGPPATLASLLVDGDHNLFQQSWAPRAQRHGTVNADGFGVGWYPAGDPVPARYRQAGPIWADPNFAELARVTTSGAVLAAVRDATVGTAAGAEAAAPYRWDRWLFSHNGAVAGWPESVAGLAGTLSPVELLALDARTDSALVWALIVNRLRAGLKIEDALREVVTGVLAVTGARLNLLVTDGSVIAATVAGDSLSHLDRLDEDGRLLVASEPTTDDPGWVEVPDGSVLLASADGIRIRPLIGEAA